MEKRSKIIRNIILVFAVSFVVVMLIVANDMKEILDTLKNVNPKYLAYTLLVTSGYWFLWSLSLQVLAKHRFEKITSLDNYLVAGSDLFFNAITPFGSGGQPFQLYAYTRVGMPGVDGTSALMMNFIIHQLVMNSLNIIAMIFFFEKVKNAVQGFMIFIVIGIIINFVILGVLILLSMWKRARVLIEKLIDLLCKVKVFRKFLGNKKEKFSSYVQEFQASFLEILKNKWLLCKTIILRTLCLLLLYAIPFFIIKSLNAPLEVSQLMFIIALSSFNFTFMSWLPTPGGSGGAEFGFKTLLGAVPNVGTHVATATMLLWRFFTYYLSMIYGLILYLIFEKRRGK